MLHVSASPSLIPDGRMSRVRLAVSAVLVLSSRSLPQRAAAEVHAHLHLSRLRFTTPLAIGSVYHSKQAQVLCGVTRMAITVPRAPSPPWGVTPPKIVCPLPPCWVEALPDGIASICVEVLGPIPRRASAVPMPVSSRRTSASPDVPEVRRAATPAMLATAMTNPFRGCSHAFMFRLPHLLGPQVAPTAEAQSLLGSRAVYATQRTCGYPPRAVVSLRA